MSAGRIPRVLSIAGSDSGGGAGIQADLKAFAACGVHGMTAITAITAQNTIGVTAVHAIPPDIIIAQVRAVASDIGVDAVKIGMLGTVETIEAVVAALDELPSGTPVVLDPVMVAESGAELLAPAARESLIELLAAPGDGRRPRTCPRRGHWRVRRRRRRGRRGSRRTPRPRPSSARVHALGPRYVVVTGGHRRARPTCSSTASELVEIPGERHPDGAAHGSGCTHSSVLAARLAWGDEPLAGGPPGEGAGEPRGRRRARSRSAPAPGRSTCSGLRRG